ncbi:MAG: insulinase family protein [Ruminococcaceae bacterium]|nr:insulinase family protein [Oscillospiraceae bacterium]
MTSSVQIFESELLGETYYRVTHASGLPVYVFPKEMSTTHALLAVNYGSVDNVTDANGNKPFPDGIAHFLEHKLFSNEDGSDSFERFSAYGADANAYTSHTRTVYLFTATDRFADSFGELIDFVTHPFFTKETVKKEQGIIAEEIRMCRDNPYDRCYYNMLEGLYHRHPVKTDICGCVGSISKITEKTLYDCYQTYYRPDNMALVVCGNVTVEGIMAIVNARFSMPPAKRPPLSSCLQEPATVHRSRVTDRGQVAKPIFSIGVKDVRIPVDPAERAKRDAAMGILSEMLFSESGELYNDLFDRRLISPEFSADYALTKDFGFLQISGEADDPDAVLREILAYIEEQRRKGLSRKDFERICKVEFAEWIKGFDSTEEIANTLVSFAFDGAEIFAYTQLLQNMDFDYIQSLFEEFFDPRLFTISIITPT